MRRSIFFSTCFALAVVVSSSSVALADNPRSFLRHALEGDNSEIMLGRLAADRARSPQIKEFGRTLAADHSQAREEVIRVGQRIGIERNRDVSSEAKDERDKLQHMDGRDFDREFVRYMIEDHRKDVSDFRDEAGEHHGPVSDLAARQLPTLQKHLDMAMDLGRSDDRDGRRMDRDRGYQSDRDRGDQGGQNNR